MMSRTACTPGLVALMSAVLHLVTKEQSAGRLERPDQLELDMAGPETVEEPSSLAEQHRDQLDLQHVQHAGPQAFPCRVGTVQHDVAVPGGRLRLLDARLDAVG